MADTSAGVSPQRGKPAARQSSKPRDDQLPASRIPVKNRPALPPQHVRAIPGRPQPQADNSHTGHGGPSTLPRRNRVTSFTSTYYTPPSKLPLPHTPPPPPPSSLSGVPKPLATATSHETSLLTSSTSSSLPPPSVNTHHQTSTVPMYKRAQSVGTATAVVAESARLKLLERATKARLYLLHQSGPNKFLIGGDIVESRFHITIGPQNCTCGKPHCIHLLFVMLRVLKVSPNDPILWARQLRNYEAEGLLQAMQTRISQRATPKKINKKKFDFSLRKMATEGDIQSLPLLVRINQSKEGSIEERMDANPGDTLDTTVIEGEENGEVERRREEEVEGEEEEEGGQESDKSEEEELCPICLNELDEGEDLISCRRCTNRLHQHCMDIWARELIHRKESVLCPVCRTSWTYKPSLSPSQSGAQIMPVSVPVGAVVGGGGVEGKVEVGGLRLKALSPSQIHLGSERVVTFEKIKNVFGQSVYDGVLSTDWKSREIAISHVSREVISLLLEQLKTTPTGPAHSGSHDQNWRDVREAAFLLITHASSDSVLKVFLSALELFRVILGYTVCTSEEDGGYLQSLLLPLLSTLLTRCADAQSRVKECCIDTVCHLCLGQEGPLSLGSACGQRSPHSICDLPVVMKCAINRSMPTQAATTPGSAGEHSWNWWLGRLNFMDRVIQRFTWDFLLEKCITHRHHLSPSPGDLDYTTPMSSITSLTEPLHSLDVEGDGASEEEEGEEGGVGRLNIPTVSNMCGLAAQKPTESLNLLPNSLQVPSPQFLLHRPQLNIDPTTPPYHPAAESNLLARAWYFAAYATHSNHNKVSKVARRVIIRIAKVLRDEPFSLEIVHDVVGRCHRSQAEGLLDRVYRAREKPLPSYEEAEHEGRGRARTREKEKRSGVLRGRDPEKAIVPRRKVRLSALGGGVGDEEKRRSDAGSDDSYRSAVSEFSGDEMERKERREEAEKEREARRGGGGGRGGGEKMDSEGREVSSSGTSTDSKSGEQMRSTASGGGGGGGDRELPRYYNRQTTADSAFSTDMESSLGDSYGVNRVFRCKLNIEEEEAEAEAKVRSMLPEDPPHPSLYGLEPPTAEVLIHVQHPAADGAEGTDGGSYIEGKHWVKGKLIGTGAFCSCFLARDSRVGTMMAVKQVSYVRNTRAQEEDELKRLREEIMMLGRLSHPNIVRCLGATQHDGHVNIFVEWMAGGCVDQVLHDFGPFMESVIISYSQQIIHGIVYLHENGIIHRDLKGGNILLDSTGRRIRIADFGAAARLATNTTAKGEFQDMEGTVAFMAPEVVRGGTAEDDFSGGYGRKCDVWSIGCVILQMATAKPPWAGTYDVRNKYQLIFKIGHASSPPPIPSFSDPALKDLTLRCLEVNATERPISSDLLKHPLFTAA